MKIKLTLPSVEEWISIGIVTYVFYSIINGGFMQVCHFLNIPYQYIRYILYSVEVFFFLIGALCALFRNARKFIIIYLMVVILLLLTIIVWPENYDSVRWVLSDIVFYDIPLLIMAISLRNTDFIFEMLRKVAPICVVAGILCAINATNFVEKSYSMWLGYQLLLPLLILNWEFINTRNVFSFGLYIAGIAVTIFRGSRAPILALMAYFLISLYEFYYHVHPNLKANKAQIKVGKKRYRFFFVLLLVGIFAAMAYVLTNIKSIALVLYNWFLQRGYFIRSFYTLIRVSKISFSSISSGRDSLYDAAWKCIVDSPVIGYGICGDRVALARATGVDFTVEEGATLYPHNVFIEILLQFGLVLGSILIIVLLIAIVRILRKSRRFSSFYCLFGLIAVCAIGTTIFSNTYLSVNEFWIMLGLAFNISAALNHEPIALPNRLEGKKNDIFGSYLGL